MHHTLHETEKKERAVLAEVVLTRDDPAEAADSLEELRRLADTAGMEVVGQLTQSRLRPDGGLMFGKGKVEDLAALVQETRADTVIFDNPLNAIQAFNLEKKLPGIRILDRTEIILLIFSRRARSAEAQLQVELARQEFLLQRIPVLQEQQRFGGGTTGLRGPGESRLQLRNRPIRKRIQDLKARLRKLENRPDNAEKRRWPLVSLVGYTNAGKSTLLNLLTRSEAYVDDRLFATLDTKTRLARLSASKQVLLTDTVGFIRNLPHDLVASFRSTLSVAARADLLLIVVDAAYPRVEDHLKVCFRTLKEIGAGDVPRLLVLNKCDTLPKTEAVEAEGGPHTLNLAHLTERYPQAIPVSAKTGYGIDLLKLAMIGELERCCTLWQLPSATSATSRRAP